MTLLSYELGTPLGAKASLGLIVLRTDETIEADFRRLVNAEGVALYTARLPCETELTPEAISRMQDALQPAAALLPRTIEYDVIGYACTSGTTIIGADNVAREIRRGAQTRHVTDPLTAIRAACAALNIKRLGFLSPYVAEVSTRMHEILEADGLEIVSFGTFAEESDERIARIDAASIKQAARDIAADAPCDALFMSCTNLRAVSVIEELEAELGIPVLSSSQALAWHMLRLSGQPTAAVPYGALMRV